jgi:hypothetical protein
VGSELRADCPSYSSSYLLVAARPGSLRRELGELLPLLNSGGVVLPRNDRLVAQLVGLERRTARGTGRDSIDHPPGARDDIANVVAGVALLARAPGYDTSLAWIDGTPIGDPSSHDPRRSMRSR